MFILFSIFFNVKDSQFKSGEVTYTISFNKLKSRVYGSKTKELIKNSVDVDYSLVFNNNESIYQKIKVMDNDVNPSINLTKIAAGADNVFYFNLTTNENLYNNKGHDELFLISQKKYNWKLTKENRKIGKYNCYKAIALNDGKISDVIAWYTIDIPLGFGPKYYNGLPGLILELNTKQVSFKATKIKLSEKQKNIEKPSEGIKITYEDYKKRFKGIFNDR
ncbi:GLPGLI family protein [Flaviramulus basaltis]|uniref:GLPGLI family protein n=1 Tax=Flaviramulus basaltis TaxID=369401 RepID=A0A1K2IE78_9FLAO|nr:GLPGLI family protein [Flaviramulus basaltis]SFZ90019.1 GLPGLI family protein [Flaviramulus basaltis]